MSQAIKVARIGSQGGVPLGRSVSRGDPGIFGFLGKVAKKVVGAVVPGANLAFSAIDLARGAGRPQSVAGPNMFASPSGQRVTQGPNGTTAQGAPRGMRLNKTDYFLRDGTFVPAGTKWVKVRRRNPANARATSRAISRIDGAKRMQHVLANIETKRFTKAGNKKSCG